MRTRFFLMALFAGIAVCAAGQTDSGAAVRRINEAVSRLREQVSTYSLRAESYQRALMKMSTDGVELFESTDQRSTIDAAVRVLPDGTTNVSGEFTIVVEESSNGPQGEASATSDVSGELRLVDNTLYANVNANGAETDVPRGWAVLVNELESNDPKLNRLLFTFPGVDELPLEELLGPPSAEGDSSSAVAAISQIISAAEQTHAAREFLSDGTPVERLSVELNGPQALEVASLSSDGANPAEGMPAEFMERLLQDAQVLVNIFIDEQERFRGISLELQLRLDSDLQSLLGEMAPEDSEGSIAMDMVYGQSSTYLNLNEPVPPATRP